MIRPAAAADLDAVNRLREQVNALHVAGRPDVFRPGFCPELRAHAAEFLGRDDRALLVCERDGRVAGFACVERAVKPLSPYNLERSFTRVEELGVDEGLRRAGVGRELFEAIDRLALAWGCPKVELDMWAFNEGALRFYEAMGFRPYRLYMERDARR